VSGMHPATFVSPNTEYVFVGSRFPAPIPLGRYVPLDKYKEEYRSVQAAVKVDPKSGKMSVAWEIELPPISCDKSDCGKLVSDGWVFYSTYNTEMASRDLEVEASQNDRDFIVAINWKVAEKAAEVEANYRIVAGVKVMDPNKVPGMVYFIPCPNSPHGVDVSPNGKYLIGNGKLSPVVAVFDFEKVLKAIEAKDYEEAEWQGWKIPVLKYDSVMVAEVPVGLGPLHTQFDNEGYAYTSLFVESAVAKWKLETWEVVDKVQVHYNIGHLVAAHGDTVNPHGKYLVALNKLSKDHFLNVGPSHPENHQLIDIAGEKMKLLYDGPSQPEPHYAVMIHRDVIEKGAKPIKIFPKDPSVPNSTWKLEDARIEKKADGTHVYMVVVRSRIVPDLVEVEEGETLFFHVTNIEDDPDITHGFGFCFLNSDMQVEPGETKTLKITPKSAGVWPFYCTNFCSALHQEMSGYLMVTPKK
ncbi:MAG: Sec-dependent nitrous-oxide reductase, partial [bacterium]|nr:Sec-dependent nitrous-oxide reductase [bacterium]